MKGKHKGHHKHMHRAHGGASGGREHMVVSGNPDVLHEAHEKHGTAKKHGGRTKHHRATGGKVEKTPELMTGGAVRPRLDRPGRKRGGRVGADKSPLSSAHSGSHGSNSTPRSGDTYGGTPPG